MKRRLFIALSLAVFAVCMITVPSFALDESEVESAVAASGNAAVAGHVFIWFLCAVAFLRVSQKIDSFLSSLGLNIGRGGGSMLGELLIAGRAISVAAKSAGSVINSAVSRGGAQAAAAGHAAGAASAVGAGATGVAQGAAGKTVSAKEKGVKGTSGGTVFASDIRNGGRLAAGIVSTVARGNASTLGTISGPRAAQALSDYLGYGPGSAAAAISGEDIITPDGGTAAGAEFPQSGFVSSGSVTSEPPTYRDVEIGGGQITGYETDSGGVERRFAMYSASQYMEPESGTFETVETVDGETWYRQYAEPAAPNTASESDGGLFRFEERSVDQLPQIPRRKDDV